MRSLEDFEGRPSLQDIRALAALGVYVICPPSEPMWRVQGAQSFTPTALFPNSKEPGTLHHLPAFDLLWFPRPVEDWLKHPKILQVFEAVRYWPKEGGDGTFHVSVEQIDVGRRAFLLSRRTWHQPLASGELGVRDLTLRVGLPKLEPPPTAERLSRFGPTPRAPKAASSLRR